eukprot:CAMPEP_0195072230 /NCGR_PEP_ID=MMETSP0448-20130528/15861_1 /TAXON_ID=66468 /ORGANISM="Heterocapsa triquestra, Strain CCMP 448" /LENGTH=77 /DNA_ID=CAMNT_0040104183 /DNA_START=29 /DNA_END=259 /DNA_ORIENTATION=+
MPSSHAPHSPARHARALRPRPQLRSGGSARMVGAERVAVPRSSPLASGALRVETICVNRTTSPDGIAGKVVHPTTWC